jgi:hypothetical protein
MRPAGRPREFDQPLKSELLDHIGQGASVAQAAHIVGTSLRTVQREAKLNDDFHNDLKLALETAPVNPERLMGRAARAHWRAAAWMLERSDPDRYGKRPPNSCREEELQTIMTQLIELALETTPADEREAAYRRMRSLADQAGETLTPDPREGRRWFQALATRATPLSDKANGQPVGARKEPDEQWLDEVDGERDEVGQQRDEVGQQRDEVGQQRDEVDAEQPDPGPSSIAPADGAIAGSLPPDGGIMSPKMRVATKGEATEFAAMGPVPTEPAADPSAPANASLPRPQGRNAKAIHNLEKAQARRARRQAARAKRKGRKAA